MANATWPSTLPQNVLTQGFSEEPQDGTIRSSMSTGKPKRRQRFTATTTDYKLPIRVTVAQKTILDTFYHTTLNKGSLPFDWKDPVSGDAATFYFSSPPTYRGRGRRYLTATLSVETDP